MRPTFGAMNPYTLRRVVLLAGLTLLVAHCSKEQFAGAISNKDEKQPPNQSSALTVPVGTQSVPPDVDPQNVASCTATDPTVATVDAHTCVVTGVTPGTTSVVVRNNDGTTTTVAVQVTPGNTGLNLPVGKTMPVLVPGGGAVPPGSKCTVANPAIVKIDPTTCAATGVAPGSTTEMLSLPNGTTANVPITVTPDLGTAGGDSGGGPGGGSPGGSGISTDTSTASGADGDGPVSSDGILTAGDVRFCAGGPSHAQFPYATEADARACFATIQNASSVNSSATNCKSAARVGPCSFTGDIADAQQKVQQVAPGNCICLTESIGGNIAAAAGITWSGTPGQ